MRDVEVEWGAWGPRGGCFGSTAPRDHAWTGSTATGKFRSCCLLLLLGNSARIGLTVDFFFPPPRARARARDWSEVSLTDGMHATGVEEIKRSLQLGPTRLHVT